MEKGSNLNFELQFAFHLLPADMEDNLIICCSETHLKYIMRGKERYIRDDIY